MNTYTFKLGGSLKLEAVSHLFLYPVHPAQPDQNYNSQQMLFCIEFFLIQYTSIVYILCFYILPILYIAVG